jgi:putative aldouronate transport system substrate-binding protein
VLGAFGIANSWNVVDGKIIAREELPGFKEYLEFMASIYKEGLIDREMPVNKGSTVTEKFGSGRAGIMVQNSFSVGPIVDALTKSVTDSKYKYIEPIIGKNGQQGVQQNCGYDYLTYIPKASKHPEDAMKWINLKLQKDTFKGSTIGQEGVHHKFENGVYSSILPKFNEDFGSAYYYLTGTDEEAYAKYWIARLQRDMRTYDTFMQLQQGVGKYSKLDVTILATNVPNFTKNELTLNQMTSDYMVKVVAGAEPISSIDAYVKKWKEAGGDTSTKEINEWYKRYLQIAK